MPNWFTRGAERIGQAVGRLFGQAPDVTRVPTGPLPGAERPGLGERLRNIVQPGRAERERMERELAELRERAEQAERRADTERQARENAGRQVQTERAERERVERERPAPVPQPTPAPQRPEVADIVKDAMEKDREAREAFKRDPERTDKMRPVQPGADPLANIQPEISFGPKGQAGAIYSRHTDAEAMRDLQRAADGGNRVTIRVHDVNGWHEMFVNIGRQAGKGISADYLLNEKMPPGMSLNDYIRGYTTGSSGSANGTGGTPGYTFSEDLDAFQVVVYS